LVLLVDFQFYPNFSEAADTANFSQIYYKKQHRIWVSFQNQLRTNDAGDNTELCSEHKSFYPSWFKIKEKKLNAFYRFTPLHCTVDYFRGRAKLDVAQT